MILLATFLESWHRFLRYLIARSLHVTTCIPLTDLPISLLLRLCRFPLLGSVSLLCHYIAHIQVRDY